MTSPAASGVKGASDRRGFSRNAAGSDDRKGSGLPVDKDRLAAGEQRQLSADCVIAIGRYLPLEEHVCPSVLEPDSGLQNAFADQWRPAGRTALPSAQGVGVSGC